MEEVSTNLVEDRGERERGSGGGSPLVRGSGGSCNLIQFYNFSDFFRISWCFGVLNSAICNSFHNRVEFGKILEGL